MVDPEPVLERDVEPVELLDDEPVVPLDPELLPPRLLVVVLFSSGVRAVSSLVRAVEASVTEVAAVCTALMQAAIWAGVADEPVVGVLLPPPLPVSLVELKLR